MSEDHRHALIIGGKEYECAAKVMTWHEHGYQFRVGEGYNKRRRRDIDLWVWHWTGAENPPKTVIQTLKERKLGIETLIYRGVIWQLCDPLIVDTADAGIVNFRSGGTEIVNYGFRSVPDLVPIGGRTRDTYTCIMRDVKRRFAHFRMADIAAALALADTLNYALKIPKWVPTTVDHLTNRSTVIRNTLSDLNDFSGHVGHFHVSDEKADPGIDLLEIFRVAWANEL